MASSSSYTLSAIFERTVDTPRSEWPLELIDRVNAVDNVVDSLFPDLSAAWVAPGAGDSALESHRRVIEVLIKATTPASADIALQRVRALIREVCAELELGRVTLVTTPADNIEVLG